MDVKRESLRFYQNTNLTSRNEFGGEYHIGEDKTNRWWFMVRGHNGISPQDYSTDIFRTVPHKHYKYFEVRLNLIRRLDLHDSIMSLDILQRVFQKEFSKMRVDEFILRWYNGKDVIIVKVECEYDTTLQEFFSNPKSCVKKLVPLRESERIMQLHNLAPEFNTDEDLFNFIKELGKSNYLDILKQSHDFICSDIINGLRKKGWLEE